MIGSKVEEGDRSPLLFNGGRIMAQDSNDLFYAIKDDVSTQVEKLKVKYEKFLDLVKNSDTTLDKFKDFNKVIHLDVRGLNVKNEALSKSIQTVIKNRLSFPHIKDAELESRKKFVEQMKAAVDDVRNGIDSQQVKNKMEGDFQRLRQKGKGGPVGEENINIKYNNEINAIDKDNTKFIKNQQQMIKESIADQDVQLNQLDLAVTRLHHIGIDIKEEGELQDKMLDNLKTDLDDAGDKMGVVMGSLSKLLKTKDGCQIWTIVILAVILIILVALIIWV